MSTRLRHQFDFSAMNTQIDAVFETDPKHQTDDAEIIDNIRNWFSGHEKRFSRFLPDSELCYLNRNSGKRLLVSDAMIQVLSLAEMYQRKTKGIFSYFLLDALLSSGYSRSFDQLNQSVHLHQIIPQTQPNEIMLDVIMRSVQLPAGARIDLGGIAKSWSVEMLIRRLQRKYQLARGLINAGGDLQVWGGYHADEPWCIGIADPFNQTNPEAEIALCCMFDGACATSSVLGRRWKSNSGEMHHLIDPRTMHPSRSDIIQCTVTGYSAVECEIWAKVVCILGSTESIPLIHRHLPHADVLFVRTEGDLHFIGSKKRFDKQWHNANVDFFHHTNELPRGKDE